MTIRTPTVAPMIGQTFRLRNGQILKIVGMGTAEDYPFIGFVLNDKGLIEDFNDPRTYTTGGRFLLDSDDSDKDLISVYQPPTVVYLNVGQLSTGEFFVIDMYDQCAFASREEADEYAPNQLTRVGCIRVELTDRFDD